MIQIYEYFQVWVMSTQKNAKIQILFWNFYLKSGPKSPISTYIFLHSLLQNRDIFMKSSKMIQIYEYFLV